MAFITCFAGSPFAVLNVVLDPLSLDDEPAVKPVVEGSAGGPLWFLDGAGVTVSPLDVANVPF
jgi:hypothetical protein